MGGGQSSEKQNSKGKYEVPASTASPSEREQPQSQPQQPTSTSHSSPEPSDSKAGTSSVPSLKRKFGPWTAVYDGVELQHFRHEQTGERVGKDELFAEWERLEDEHNRPYFHNLSDGKTQWEAPAGYYEWVEEQEKAKIRSMAADAEAGRNGLRLVSYSHTDWKEVVEDAPHVGVDPVLFFWNPSRWEHDWEKPDELIMAQLKANTIELEVTCTKDELEAELFKLRESHERENDEGRKALDAERRKRNIKLQERLKMKSRKKGNSRTTGRSRKEKDKAKGQTQTRREEPRNENLQDDGNILRAGVAAAQATIAAMELSCPWTEYLDETSGTPYYFNEATQVSQWDPPQELLELYEKEEEAFLRAMYARGRECPELVRIGPEIGGWQEVEVLAQPGGAADEETCVFYHKVRTGANQFEKPIKMVAAKYAAEEEELSQTCEAEVLKEKMEEVRLQHAESLGALRALNIGKRDLQRKKLRARLRKKKRGSAVEKEKKKGGSAISAPQTDDTAALRSGRGNGGGGGAAASLEAAAPAPPPPPPPRGKAKLRKSKGIAALMVLEDEDDEAEVDE